MSRRDATIAWAVTATAVLILLVVVFYFSAAR
jgi:hypothetical protein